MDGSRTVIQLHSLTSDGSYHFVMCILIMHLSHRSLTHNPTPAQSRKTISCTQWLRRTCTDVDPHLMELVVVEVLHRRVELEEVVHLAVELVM